jgi:hypothetical protein
MVNENISIWEFVEELFVSCLKWGFWTSVTALVLHSMGFIVLTPL